MKLYNSLTKQVEGFGPLKKDQITLYTCGPTVYERAHIGNLASFIYADTLKRALKAAFPEHEVKHVMNITDVDDKTIAKSQQKYPGLPPAEALKKLTRHFEDLFKEDLESVGIDTADITFIRATDSIELMQKLIRQILDKGLAYLTDDGVFFNTIEYHNKYAGSGKGYGQLTDTAVQGLVTESQRTNSDEYEKHQAIDFALWKVQKPNEPSWDFEVNGKNIAGRPGWHIECSAMSVGELGQPFDIHTGGVDLKFPHHENEIAQTRAATGEDLAKVFFHSEHILVDGKKMSKSLNNFYTLDDVHAKGFDPLAFRLLILQSHYRSQAHFSWDNLQAAQNRLRDLRMQGGSRGTTGDLPDAMLDDLNVPLVLSAMSGPVDSSLDQLLGLKLTEQGQLTAEQDSLVKQRETARQNKDWAEADRIRQELEEQKIGVNDTDTGPVWYRL